MRDENFKTTQMARLSTAATSINLTLLDTEYIGTSKKYKLSCPSGHTISCLFDNIIRGTAGCAHCSKNAKHTIHEFTEYATSLGYEVPDGQEYCGAHSLLKCVCTNHGEFITTWDRLVNAGRRCPACSFIQWDTTRLREFVSDCGYVLVDGQEYNKLSTKYEMLCPEHGKIHMSLSSLTSGKRCRACYATIWSIELLTEFVKSLGYTLVPGQRYINSKIKYQVICDSHGLFTTSLSNLRSGQRCPSCSSSSGKFETECRRIVELLLGVPFCKTRSVIPGVTRNYELDMYNNDLKLALEYQGKQHYEYHPFLHNSIDDFTAQQSRDAHKRLKCSELGIQLIEIPYTVAFSDLADYITARLKEVAILE